MSIGAGRLDDLRRRSSVTKLETSPVNNNISALDGPDHRTGRTCRTSSLALPPERALLDLLVRDQALLQPMNVSHLPPANQLPRRHSAHCCPPEHKPSMVSAQPPPIPLRPPAVPERSKIGPPPPISGVRFTSTQGSGHPYLKQMPSTLTQQQNLPQQSQHQKPIQPPIPPPHIPHQSKSQQQPIKNINTQLPMKQKPLKPKILPSIPPQSHTLHQQSQAQQPNKQPQSGTLKVAGSSQVPQNKQPTSLQSQIQQSLNQSQLQQLQQSKMSQPQSHMTQNLGKQAINMQQQIQPQSLNQSQMPQTLKQQQNQNSQIHTKQSNIPSQQSQQSQKPTMTQPIQNQQQMTVAPTRVEQQITQQSFSNACNNKISVRQDSNVSSDSFSQNSSPSYTTKTMETPLLPHHAVNSKNASNQYQKVGGGGNKKILNSSHGDSGNGTAVTGNDVSSNGNAALTKSISTPASLQTIVRFHHGSNMSLHHRIIRDMRRPSAHYVTRGRLRFRFAQVLVNAVALLAIAGGLAAYFRAYPSTVRYVNKTVTTTTKVLTPPEDANPAPGICLPVIVSFCQYHRVPYNFTMFPNYMGHFTQRDAQQELEVYDAVVDVRCYELAALFLCSVFVPKCGPTGQLVRPCRSICYETKRRCGFFLDVFGLSLPDYLDCQLFPESPDPDVCVGHQEVIDAKIRAQQPVCNAGFQCDTRRCIPADWKCDGHVDCEDQSDELNCEECAKGMIHCGEKRCMAQSHMCDGVEDCPWGQDERNCLRLSERMGDVGRGKLEIFQPEEQNWQPACVTHWDSGSSANYICSQMGYTSANYSRLTLKSGDEALPPSSSNSPSIYKFYKEKQTNLLKELRACPGGSIYPNVELSCANYACGKRRHPFRPSTRIVGGVESAPGDWPFLAALLGGPEEVFYCAGVLIADQWVLTASHCVGNQTNPDGWTIQLGITRRHAHSYFGQKMKVKRVVPHPMYNMGVAHDNDVALFQLKSRVTFHEHLLPVCLPPPNHELVPGTVCTVIGWGKREDKDASEYEPAVNEVQVPVLNRELCNVWLQHRDLNVTEGMICAGYPEGGKDACQGDSGGPLLCRDEKHRDRWFVGGIVSWGIKCAHPHLPGVYAYVPKYVPWITQQMALHSNEDKDPRS
ncbi:uncharacterized protein [Periplaneta americana]|uniref:uncharacterized protein n=1 Tax=Periplaneta americana TaxID=6978 RepID=UPI0037E893F2